MPFELKMAIDNRYSLFIYTLYDARYEWSLLM